MIFFVILPLNWIFMTNTEFCFYFACFFVDKQVQFIQLWKSLYDMFHDHAEEQELYHAIATVGTLLLEIGDVGKKFLLQKLSSSDLIDDAVSSYDSLSDIDYMSQAFKSSVDLDPAGTPESCDQPCDQVGQVSDGSEQEAGAVTADPVDSTKTSATGIESGISMTMSVAESQLSVAESTTSSKPDSDWTITFEQVLASMLTEEALVTFFEKQIDILSSISSMRNRRLVSKQTTLDVDEK